MVHQYPKFAPVVLFIISIICCSFVASAEIWISPLRAGATTSTNAPVYSSAHDLIIIATADVAVVAVRRSNGSEAWRTTFAGDIETTGALNSDESLIYYGGRDRKLHALNTTTGAVVWAVTQDRFLDASPYAKIGTVACATTSSYKVFLADGATGAVRWTWTNPVTGSFRAGMFIREGAVYAGDSLGTLTRLDLSSGAVLTQRTFVGEFEQAVRVVTYSPLGSGRTFYRYVAATTAGAVHFMEYDLSTTGEATITLNGAVVSPPQNAVGRGDSDYPDGDLYVAATFNGRVYGLHVTGTTVKTVWTNDLPGTLSAKGLAIPDAYVRSGSKKSVFLIGNSLGQLYCLDVKNGDILFRLDYSGALSPGPILAGLGPAADAGLQSHSLIAFGAGSSVVLEDVSAAISAGRNAESNTAAPVESSSAAGLSGAAITGIVIGALVLVVILAIALFVVNRGRENAPRRGPPAGREMADRRPYPRPADEAPQRRRVPSPMHQNNAEHRIYGDEPDAAPVTVAVAPAAPTDVRNDELTTADEEERQLRVWRAMFVEANRSVADHVPPVELPWAYIRRLTREFTDNLVTKAGHRCPNVFYADEFIEGVLLRFVVKIIDAHGVLGAAPFEVSQLAGLRHQNICPIVSWGRDPLQAGRYCVVTRFQKRGSVADCLLDGKTRTQFTPNHRLLAALGALRGIQHLHHHRILHRDIKAANVVLSDAGEAEMIDFDVAAVSEEAVPGNEVGSLQPKTIGFTANRRVYGTPGYICPAYGRLLCGYGVLQEVYSFGVFVMELLTGTLASPSNDLADPARQVVDAETTRIHGPFRATERLMTLCRMAMSQNPADRPTFFAFAETLKLATASSAAVPNNQLGVREMSAVSFEGDDDRGVRCSVCWEPAPPQGVENAGIECSATQRHYMCKECLNNRIGTAVESGSADLLTIGCPMPGCAGRWFFADFAPLLAPEHLREWHERALKVARKEGRDQALTQQEAIGRPSQSIAHHHAAEVRRLLRPSCPHCGLPFESFSGCTFIRCRVPGANALEAGCGGTFCGACLTPTPCAKGHGHTFLSQRELHTAWAQWRAERVCQYLRANVHDPNSKRLVLEISRLDLEACDAWDQVERTMRIDTSLL